MPRNKRYEIAARREKVAQLSLRGLSQREIARALPKNGIINPNTGKGYTVGIINRDLKALRKEWMRTAIQAIDEHKALILAKLDEAERAAWAKGQITTVLKALDQKAGIVGVKAPEKQSVTGEVIFRVVRDDPGSDNPPEGAASEAG